MAEGLKEESWSKKAKWLTHALIISAALNVGLLSTFVYFAIRNDKKAEQDPLPLQTSSLEEVIEQYKGLSYQDLLLNLNKLDLVGEGYTKRDISLACLAAFHHFNLEKALGGIPLDKQIVQCKNQSVFPLFPQVTNDQYLAILQYAKTEKWPFTAFGLFCELQQARPPYDPFLVEAFALTSPFHFINLLFSKTAMPLKKEHCIALLVQGEWESICKMSNHLRLTSEFSLDQRRKFLIELIEQKSKLAAKLLVELDRQYCLEHLTKVQILRICALLREKLPASFLKELLKTTKEEEIWKMVATVLYEQASEDVPAFLNLEKVKLRFLELKDPLKPVLKQGLPKDNFFQYTVVAGDSLWKIANKHKTTVENLRKGNQLKTDSLRVGQVLKVSQGT